MNGPEILDKYVGEAERRVRELFAPAEAEWAAAGDASELHVIILDEMDSIARTRGAADGDTSGVRDSVVNQLLAKMDGVVEAANVLVIGCHTCPLILSRCRAVALSPCRPVTLSPSPSPACHLPVTLSPCQADKPAGAPRRGPPAPRPPRGPIGGLASRRCGPSRHPADPHAGNAKQRCVG